MNNVLGNVGATVVYTADDSSARPANQLAGLQELVGEMNGGTVAFLMIMGGNPVYTAPADLNFAAALQKVTSARSLGLYEDETRRLCQWHVPETHSSQAWSDVRADDGTVTIVQPLIAPLYGGKSPHEVRTSAANARDELVAEMARARFQGHGHRGVRPRPPRHRCRRDHARRRGPGAGRIADRGCDGRRRPSTSSGADGCTTASCRTRLLPRRRSRVSRRRRPAAGGAQAGPGSRVPPRPERLRRAVREQRLAAGAPQAADEIDVGQRRADHRRATARLACAHHGECVELTLRRPHRHGYPVWIAPGQATDVDVISATGERARGRRQRYRLQRIRLRTSDGARICRRELVKTGDTTCSLPPRTTGRSKAATSSAGHGRAVRRRSRVRAAKMERSRRSPA